MLMTATNCASIAARIAAGLTVPVVDGITA